MLQISERLNLMKELRYCFVNKSSDSFGSNFGKVHININIGYFRCIKIYARRNFYFPFWISLLIGLTSKLPSQIYVHFSYL